MYSFRHGLVIGINYDNLLPASADDPPGRGELHRLHYAESDAERVAAQLEEDGYIVERVLGAKATRQEIIKWLEYYKETTGPDQLLLVYFAGHGALDSGGTAYLLPSDFNVREIPGTAIRLEDIGKWHLSVSADPPSEYALGTAVMLLDCCYSGQGVRVASLPPTSGLMDRAVAAHLPTQIPGRVLISAGGDNERVREDDRLRAGVFTHAIVDTWRSVPELDLDQLFRVAASRLEAEGHPVPIRGGLQRGVILLRDPAVVRPSTEESKGDVVSKNAEKQGQGAEMEAKRDLDPESEEMAVWGDKLLARLQKQFQEAVSNSNQVDGIISLGERILTISQNQPSVRKHTIEALKRRIQAATQRQDFGAVINDATLLIEFDPGDAEGFASRATGYFRSSNPRAALDDWRRATELDDQNEEYWLGYGHAAARVEDYASAVQFYRRSIRLAEVPPYRTLVDLGSAYEAMGTLSGLNAALDSYKLAKAASENADDQRTASELMRRVHVEREHLMQAEAAK